jgi:hypothetical protein
MSLPCERESHNGAQPSMREKQLRREPGLIHNFMMLDDVSPACGAAADRVAEDLRALLS